MKVRSRKGSMALLAFIGMIPLLAAIGAFGVDMMHVNSTKGELQKACDAGALAGANQLWCYDTDTPKGDTATKRALVVTGLNPADGKLVADADPQMTVTSVVSAPPVAGVGGRVRVDASVRIRSIFAHLFGANFQTVTASSEAGPLGMSETALSGSLFPLLVSIDQQSPDGTFLKDKGVGQPFSLGWQGAGENVFWTSLDGGPTNNSGVGDLMDAYRDPGNPKGHKAVKIGNSVDAQNGVTQNAKDIYPNFNGKVLVLPVTTGGWSKPKTVIGWIGFKVTGESGTGSGRVITGEITAASIYGSGPPAPPDPTYGTFFNTVTVSPVKLLQ